MAKQKQRKQTEAGSKKPPSRKKPSSKKKQIKIKDQKKPDAKKHPFIVVGVGASAGGLDAFRHLLRAIPADSGMAYVLVQHLHPKHESLLPEILSRETQNPVHEISNNIHIEPNHIYIVPENNMLKSVDGVLKLIKRDGVSRQPIDFFFRSLADVYKRQSVGIVLSGTGNDGMLGLKAIKGAGGVTLAQDETTAAYPGMPTSAINAGVVDFILPPDKMPEQLQHLKNGLAFAGQNTKGPFLSEGDAMTQILYLLRQRTGVDFTFYKRTTLNRRIQRRMKHHHKTRVAGYLEVLRHSKIEQDALFNEFLITVTSFFREPETFKALTTKVLPDILSHNKSIRIWVVGCAGGPEAYTIAMCLAEFLGNRLSSIEVKIFATDLSQKAIAKARLGMYTKDEVAGVSATRLKRFFVKTDGGYHIMKALRDMCVFAPHNLLNDPPFSGIDLVSCRNVMIYMDPVLQKKALAAFHYSLKDKGYLLLGKSESVSGLQSLFSTVDARHKLYRKTKSTTARFMPSGYNTREHTLRAESTTRQEDAAIYTGFQRPIDELLLAKYVPAAVVVNEVMDILQFRGATGHFLEPAPGKASFNLFKMVRHPLAYDLRNALQKAKSGKKPMKIDNVMLPVNGHQLNVTIEVVPVENVPEKLYLVMFRETVLPTRIKADKKKEDDRDLRIRKLEDEILMLREDIRITNEEHEAVNEEYQSANEELLSGREELQSINEELETSKEELQSANEEMMTVNSELQTRNEELAESRKYSDAIIATLHMPLVTLNGNLRVCFANNAFFKTFHATEAEVTGKYFFSLNGNQWNIAELRQLLEKTLNKKTSFMDWEMTHVFKGIGRRTLLLNGFQLDRAQDERGDLLLLSIYDVTEKKASEQLLQEKRDEFIGIASHELKTPLTSLKAMIQLCEQNVSESQFEAMPDHLSKMNKLANKLSRLIHDLLDYSKLETNKLDLEMEIFPIDDMVKDVIGDLQPATHHTIIFTGGIGKKVTGDQQRVTQALTNLITNAMKYSPNADKVIVDLKEAEGMAVVSVQDFGIGISDDDQKKIFQRYFRTESSRKFYPGFGVGLYLASELVRRMKGNLWVESKLGAGSTFCLSLPLANK